MSKLSMAIPLSAALLLAVFWGGGLEGTAVGRASDTSVLEVQAGAAIADQEAPEPREQQVAGEELPPDAVSLIEPIDGGSVSAGWIVLSGALLGLLLLMATWWAGRLRASAAEHSSWQGKALEAYANGSAIHDAVAVQLSRNSSRSDPVMLDVEHRMSELTVQLHSLETRPTGNTAKVLRMLGALAALRWAACSDVSIRASVGPDDRQREDATALTRRRLAEFRETLIRFKTSI